MSISGLLLMAGRAVGVLTCKAPNADNIQNLPF